MFKIIWCNLCPPGYSQEKVLKTIIDNSLTGNGSLIADNRTARSRFFHGTANQTCIRYMNHLLKKRPTIETMKGNSDSPNSFQYWDKLKVKWQSVLNEMDASDKEKFLKHIDILLGDVVPTSYSETVQHRSGEDFWKYDRDPEDPNKPYVFKFAAIDLSEALKKQSIAGRLASMSLIALTWTLWEEFDTNPKFQEDVLRLARLMFPNGDISRSAEASENVSGSLLSPLDSIKTTSFADQKYAIEKVEEAENCIKGLHPDYQRAGELCDEVITLYRFATDYTLGKALFILGCCCEPSCGGYPLPKMYDCVEDIFRDADSYGCSEARERIKSPDILETPERNDASDIGDCIVNANNLISDWVEKTRPDLWSLKYYEDPVSQLRPDAHQRFILIDDDYEKNAKDALKILDAIKKNRNIDFSRWSNIEVFIRCNEEKTSPMIDTVLNYMEAHGAKKGSFVRVYLIDDGKRAAQSLYSSHPIFYPLTLSRDKNATGVSKSIHLIILAGNQNLDLATWLIREAFWFSVSLKENTHTKITVLSPFAETIGREVASACPGLASFSTVNGFKQENGDPIKIAGIPFAAIEYIDTALSGNALSGMLNEIAASSDSTYYVIDNGSDLDNLNLAIRIREWDLRHSVQLGRIGQYSQSRSVISFYCEDPDYARLSENLIVPKDENGNQWFNNYGFITFGSLKSRYAWDVLDGGIIGTIAECIHLQYNNERPNDAHEYENLTTYFNRIYNRESSYASALSLPYRLFEADIIPKAWDIQDSSAYWSSSQRTYLSDLMAEALYPQGKDGPCDQKLVLKLAKYEHARWSAYMLSRGWLPVTADQTALYIMNGSPRHNLYIARLHPCICSWEELTDLQVKLDGYYCPPNEKENKAFPRNNLFKKYAERETGFDLFTSIDFSNIEMTPEIIRADWFNREKEREDKTS